MTTATRRTNREVLLLLSERLEAELPKLGKTTQHESRQKVEQQLANLSQFHNLSDPIEEIEVCKVQGDSVQLGSLGENIDATGNFWVHWEGHRVPEPEQIFNLQPVSRLSIPGLEIGQDVSIGTTQRTISFFTQEYVVVQVEEKLQAVKASTLLPPPTPPPAAAGKKEEERTPPLCPHVLIVGERESYYKPPKITKAEVLYSTAQKVRVQVGSKAKSLAKDKLYCLFLPQNWDDFMVLYEAFQQALQAQGEAIAELGRYDLKLARQGGYNRATNPLTPFVVTAPDPKDKNAYYVTNWSVPYAILETVERHTPQMIWLVGKSGTTAQAGVFCCPTKLHFSYIQELIEEAKRCSEALLSFLTENLVTYAVAENLEVEATDGSLEEENEEDVTPQSSFSIEEFEKSVWDMTVYYLSDVLVTDEQEQEAIILTCETSTTTHHIEAIAAHFPINLREHAVTVIRKAFLELYESEVIAARLAASPTFGVGDKVQAIKDCPVGEGTVEQVCKHTVKLQESPLFFLADYFELMPTDQPSGTPRQAASVQLASNQMWLDPKLVITDAGTQSRDPASWGQREGVVSEEAITEYAQMMNDDLWDYFKTPLPVVYFDGENYYASDSHHRTEAAKLAGVELIYEVRDGDLFDAIANSCKSNRQHSRLRYTKDDQRRQIVLFLDTLENAPQEKRDEILANAPGLSDRERASWSCRTIAKYLELSEAGYRTVNNIVNERKQRQLAEELQIGERVQISSDQRKLSSFKLLASQVGGCAGRIVEKDAEKRLVKVLPDGLPDTNGFARWLKVDSVTRLNVEEEPFAKLLPCWQKGLVVDYCRETYKGLFERYVQGHEVDASFWISTVEIDRELIQLVLDYNTAMFHVEETEESADATSSTTQTEDVEEEQQEQDEDVQPDATASQTPSTVSSDQEEEKPIVRSEEEESLLTTIGNSFELLDFEFFNHIDTWLGVTPIPILEAIAKAAEQLAFKAQAAIQSRSH